MQSRELAVVLLAAAAGLLALAVIPGLPQIGIEPETGGRRARIALRHAVM